jgi:hypothetical protein
MAGVPYMHHKLINKHIYCPQGGTTPPWVVCNYVELDENKKEEKRGAEP